MWLYGGIGRRVRFKIVFHWSASSTLARATTCFNSIYIIFIKLFYKVFEDGKITKIFQNSVKKGALQNGISKDDIENELEKFLKDFKEYLNKE